VVDFACGAPTLLQGRTLRQVSGGVDQDLYRYPLGVVAGIPPFNFPVMIPLWMMPLAVVAGNTFVLKPSERTPLGAVRLAELFQEAGFPPGVLNVIHGARETVEALIAAPEVQAVSFVGSAPVARYIYEEAARHGKRVQALGGAKNHIVVMPDADLATRSRHSSALLLATLASAAWPAVSRWPSGTLPGCSWSRCVSRHVNW
jgi:malonate-semialdehyde dehydrogenase (acetylating)/methylmalonate-semialdehyde dehydrogenase